MSKPAIDTLRREHTQMRSVLSIVAETLQAMEEGRVGDFILLANALYYMRKFPSAVHHPKEDVIFDRLTAIDPVRQKDVDLARAQHHEIYQLEDWLIEMALNAPKPGTQSRARLLEFGRHYMDLQRKHCEGEERFLFQPAAALLTAKDWKEIGRRFAEIDDPVFGAHPGERYELLYRHLMRESGGA